MQSVPIEDEELEELEDTEPQITTAADYIQ